MAGLRNGIDSRGAGLTGAGLTQDGTLLLKHAGIAQHLQFTREETARLARLGGKVGRGDGTEGCKGLQRIHFIFIEHFNPPVEDAIVCI